MKSCGHRVLARLAHLPVDPARRSRGPGDPVERHVVEQPVARERALEVAVGPRSELLHDPRAQPRRRVLEPVAEGLRTRALDLLVAGAVLAPLEEPCEVGLLGFGQRRTVLRGRHRHEVEVESGHTVRHEVGDVRRDDRAPVAALRAEAVEAEIRHELDERRRDPPGVPAALVCRPGEAEPGQGRRDDVERVPAVAAVRRGIGQRADGVEELDDRARPPVHEQQRKGVGVR